MSVRLPQRQQYMPAEAGILISDDKLRQPEPTLLQLRRRQGLRQFEDLPLLVTSFEVEEMGEIAEVIVARHALILPLTSTSAAPRSPSAPRCAGPRRLRIRGRRSRDNPRREAYRAGASGPLLPSACPSVESRS